MSGSGGFAMRTPGRKSDPEEPEEEQEEEFLDDDATVEVEAERKETNTDGAKGGGRGLRDRRERRLTPSGG